MPAGMQINATANRLMLAGVSVACRDLISAIEAPALAAAKEVEDKKDPAAEAVRLLKPGPRNGRL